MNNRDKNIVGQILAKTYRIERFLGVGTVGTVYVARHVRSGGLYAVKVLHRKLAASPDLYQRFQDEARLIATLRHPHILPITDFDRDENGIPFFVMDLLEGENLQQRLKHKETLPIAQALEIVQQVGSALHTAHRSGIIHRNIKLENLFLVRHDLGDRVTETAKVMDFGLARFRRMAPAGTRDASLGVSPYMAPEMLQETTAPIDGRVDQWALAVITYRIVTGKSPFEDDNPEEMLRQILHDPPKPLPKMSPEMPAHMVAAIHRGMSKRREDRYETMMDFVRAFSSRPSTAEGDAAVAQAQKTAGSGRVGAPMPPTHSGGAVPPPMPPVAAPNAPPVAAVPIQTAQKPSAASPPTPPPDLKRPSLLISQEFKVPSIPPPRGPSFLLLAGGGVLAVLAGVGLTLLWEQRKEPRPLPDPGTLTQRGDTNSDKPVVEPLPPGNNPPTAENPVDASAAHTPFPPRGNVPPLRPAVEEVAPTPNPTTPNPTAVPNPTPIPAPTVPPPGVNPNPTPMPAPTGNNPATRPIGTPPPPSGVQPGTSAYPTQIQPRPPGPPTAGTPGQAQPTMPGVQPTPSPSPPPAPALSPGQQKSRDEVEELLGVQQNPTAPPPATPAPRPVAPRPVQNRPPAEPAAPAPAAEGEKSADKILEEAQAAYVSGERQRAIEMAMQLTRRPNPNDQLRAWRFIGSAACSVRSTTLATRAYNNLASLEHRQLLTELCKRNGLNFVDGQFVTE